MMNFFDRQLILFFKKNLIYFITLISLLGIIIYLIFQVILRNSTLIGKIRSTSEQNIILKEKIDKLNMVSNYNLEKKIKSISRLIPNNDDMFTVISTIMRLSNKLNISIPNYEINGKQIKSKKFSVKVDILTNDILNFLKNYHFSAGRLVTISSVKINTENEKYSLELNLYNFDPNQKNLINFNKLSFENFNKIDQLIEEGMIILGPQNSDDNLIPKDQFSTEEIQSSDDPFSSR